MHTVFTVGYAHRSSESMISALHGLKVKTLVDVRTLPFSRMFPQFNRDQLPGDLEKAGIDYLGMGHCLNPCPPEDEYYLPCGQANFERIAQSPRFLSGLAEVEVALKAGSVAIMCAEKAPETCHRGLLVGNALYEKGCPVGHLALTNDLESHAEMLLRLVAEQDLGGDLFTSDEELGQIALNAQIRRHAYRRSPAAAGSHE